MPVQGPEYSRQQADNALEDVLKLLKEKYGTFLYSPEEMWKISREEVIDHLRKAVHEVFKQDSFENW